MVFIETSNKCKHNFSPLTWDLNNLCWIIESGFWVDMVLKNESFQTYEGEKIVTSKWHPYWLPQESELLQSKDLVFLVNKVQSFRVKLRVQIASLFCDIRFPIWIPIVSFLSKALTFQNFINLFKMLITIFWRLNSPSSKESTRSIKTPFQFVNSTTSTRNLCFVAWEKSTKIQIANY